MDHITPPSFSKSSKSERKAYRKKLAEFVAKLTDEELKNMVHELNREMFMRIAVLSDCKMRLALIKHEMVGRKYTSTTGVDDFKISDHAVVRYLERHKGVNIGDIRNEIVTMANRSKDHGATTVKDEETGLILGRALDTNMITTVYSLIEEAIIPKV